jgi:multiple sugar transport system substrate-binding protein
MNTETKYKHEAQASGFVSAGSTRLRFVLGLVTNRFFFVGLLVITVLFIVQYDPDSKAVAPPDRQEVIFWHFWGGRDRAVVEDVVRRFNESQQEHFVHAIAMPGNNLDLKFFLSVAGGDPPDLLNQDDPVLADWAHRGLLMPLDEVADKATAEQIESWLFPPARRLGTYDGRLYGLCNGLDIRALYYDQTLLAEHGLKPPETWEALNRINQVVSPPDQETIKQFGFLPDPRRLWAWGIVFGGQFYDETTDAVTADQPPVVRAMDWMRSFSKTYGADRVAAFRSGDQSLTGSASPLLQGRYAVVMDGQWRVREIVAAQDEARSNGKPVRQYGVAPLPAPPGGRENAGWVNGNFFVVPKGSRNPAGALAFMKFWSGFDGHEAEAAVTCAAGGWIPVSPHVVKQPSFERYLRGNALFAKFVELASSPNQVPWPVTPGATYFQREITRTCEEAMYRDDAPPSDVMLREAATRIRARLKERVAP